MFVKIKDILLGPALPTHTKEDRTLNKVRALAAFSPDALASIAYANQEIYLGLVVAGSVGLSYAWPIGLAIAGLLAIVALSYYQTIAGYPSGGGSYIVARSNLGNTPRAAGRRRADRRLHLERRRQPDLRGGGDDIRLPGADAVPRDDRARACCWSSR